MQRLRLMLLGLSLAAGACDALPSFLQGNRPRASAPASAEPAPAPVATPTTAVTPFYSSVPEQLTRTWLVERAAGAPTIDRLNAPLVIGPDGRINGNSGCNRLAATARFSGTAVAISEVDSTRRVCSPMLMNQEQRVVGALREAAQWRIAQGRLVLADSSGREVMQLTPR